MTWEQRCHRCGLCCHDKVLLDDGLVIYNTHCKYMVDHQCSVYEDRFNQAPWCVKLTPKNIKQIKWLPSSCGYRRQSNDHKAHCKESDGHHRDHGMLTANGDKTDPVR